MGVVRIVQDLDEWRPPDIRCPELDGCGAGLVGEYPDTVVILESEPRVHHFGDVYGDIRVLRCPREEGDCTGAFGCDEIRGHSTVEEGIGNISTRPSLDNPVDVNHGVGTAVPGRRSQMEDR